MSFPRRCLHRVALSAGLLVAALPAFPASPTAWEMTAWSDFIQGRFDGVALSRDGRIRLAPRLDTLFSSGQPVVWTIARAPNNDLYLGTGHQGQIFRVSPNGRSELVYTAPEPEIFALAVDAKGRLFAGASPGGKIYLIEGGKATEYFQTGAKYIWSLVAAPDGSLYAGTGDEGKIFRITGQGQAEVWYETGQTHVTSLAFDTRGRLLAGSEPNGLLYHVSGKGKAFVLYDAAFPEIRSIVPAADGSIYVAAMGGAVGKKTQAAQQQAQTGQQPVVSTTVTTITVTDEIQGGIEVRPPQQPAPAQAAVAATAPAAPIVDYPGMDKSALYRIRPDNTVETLWLSKEENAYDLLPSERGLVFSTDAKGRIYRLGADRKVTLLTETRDSEILRLAPIAGGLVFGTANSGDLYRLGETLAASGAYESPVQDAGNTARWGRVLWRSISCDGCKLAIRTRTGNSARPDTTWSEWSQPLTDPAGSPAASPNARYIQWKAEMTGKGDASPELYLVRIAYLPQNNPPEVKSLTVSSQIAAVTPKPATSSSASATAAYSITVTDTGEAGASSLSGTPSQPVNRAATEELLISWAAEDPDDDTLTFRIEFRGEDEREWKMLKRDLRETQHKLDAEAFADGYYYFRVTASDRANNPPSDTHEAELTSPPVLIDRTPPALKAAAENGRIRLDAEDSASPLTRCEYSINAGTWTALAPENGILDSRRATFAIAPANLPSGEKLLVFRCYDSASNAGLARIVLP